MQDRAIVYGTKERILQPVSTITVEIIEGREVQLVASFQPLPHERAVVLPMATTLAIHMDQAAASDLFSQLRMRFQTMGWRLPE